MFTWLERIQLTHVEARGLGLIWLGIKASCLSLDSLANSLTNRLVCMGSLSGLSGAWYKEARRRRGVSVTAISIMGLILLRSPRNYLLEGWARSVYPSAFVPWAPLKCSKLLSSSIELGPPWSSKCMHEELTLCKVLSVWSELMSACCCLRSAGCRFSPWLERSKSELMSWGARKLSWGFKEGLFILMCTIKCQEMGPGHEQVLKVTKGISLSPCETFSLKWVNHSMQLKFFKSWNCNIKNHTMPSLSLIYLLIARHLSADIFLTLTKIKSA